MRGVSQAKLDLGIFRETKLTGRVYTYESARYRIIAADVLSRHCGRVAVFLWPSLRYMVKAIQQFGTNFVGFQLSMGGWQWYMIRCYLPPNDTLTIGIFVAALKERPRGSKLLVAGYLNANLDHPKGDQKE